MRRALGLTIVLSVLVLGCGGDDDGGDDASTDSGGAGAGDDGDDSGGGGGELWGRTFLSEAVTEDGRPKALVEGTEIRIELHDDGRLTASAGCNTLGGTPTLTADAIELGDGVSTTEMGCDPALHEQDGWLADFLTAGPSYALDGDRLQLTSGTTVIDLVDRETADPDRALEGTTWTLDGIVDGQTVGSVPAGVTATVVFQGGTVTVATSDCNGGSGSYELDDAGDGTGTVTFSPLASTLMGCPEPAAAVDAAIGAVLDGPVDYRVEAAALTLTHPGGRGLMLRAE